MLDMFDRLGAELNDAINTHENNNVKYAAGQVFGFAEGGAVGDSTDTTTSTDDSDLSNPLTLARTLGKAAKPLYDSGSDSALGKLSSYNSPIFLTSHLTALGKFFNGAEPGNAYTNRYKVPEQQKPLQSENPNTFYNGWAERMRQFALADQIADKGQGQVRTR